MMSRTPGEKAKNQTIPGGGGDEQGQPPGVPDMLEPAQGDVVDADSYGPYTLYASETSPPEMLPEEMTPEWLRMQARLLLREFLGVVPRAQGTTTITFLRMDGRQQTLSRQELSTAIDRMRPRQRQIVRLAVEARWSHERVCAALKGISVRTVQRDLAEALDRLAEL
jgi:DNA-directed RNA polymerase specialized sigma24 family protein